MLKVWEQIAGKLVLVVVKFTLDIIRSKMLLLKKMKCNGYNTMACLPIVHSFLYMYFLQINLVGNLVLRHIRK